MYICVCNAVSDSAIRAAVNEGVSDFRDLTFRTGCGTQCGSCVPLARAVMDEALAKQGRPLSEVKLQIVSSS
ncbi:MAG: bacterioferritin-associated ferredoxin [Xanthomonadales bacterium]|nr:bacterioferritin-associated ferredoxin [Gammaproteobacteria bacterium]MBT8063733.1 bacterioferritin-associated ferredoxin [Gammaproteobacteria bacterium]NNJ66219.1 bacterioferritin-associated ferredoxin [Xanthomonadales bacterium]NNK32735.1 bacterioferritin-associated ferredoxin [Xanthomonadales bacterium]NNK37250.1 bacterioferritin-associated ferredoxin [Xanthomonadales bacterium]